MRWPIVGFANFRDQRGGKALPPRMNMAIQYYFKIFLECSTYQIDHRVENMDGGRQTKHKNRDIRTSIFYGIILSYKDEMKYFFYLR